MSKSVRICPKCGSTDISLDSEDRLMGAVGTTAIYVCADCGHNAPIFPEVDSVDVDSFKKNLPKQNLVESKPSEKINTSYGKFAIKKYWKFAGPLVMIFGIILLIVSLNPRICEYEKVLDEELSIPGVRDYYKSVRICSPDVNTPIDWYTMAGSLFSLLLGLAVTLFAYRKD